MTLRSLWPVALAVLLTTGCERLTGKKESAPAPPPPTVVVAAIVQQPVDIVGEYVARTEAVPTVELRARVSGVLEQVLFKEGSAVKPGQVLFVIQQEEYRVALQSARAQLAKAQADLTRAQDVSIVERARASLDQAKANLGKAQADVARYRPLVQADAIPKQDLDTALSAEQVQVAAVQGAEAALKDTILSQRTQVQLAQAALEAGKAGVSQAELNLGYTTIRSPIQGIISKVAVDKGSLVGKSEPTLLATASSMDPIYVDFAIPEVEYLRFAARVPGLARGEATARDRPSTLELFLADNRVFPQKGRPYFIDRAVDPKTGTIQVRAEFPNPEGIVRAGQFARVRAVVDHVPDAILVPQIAVQDQQGAKIVLVIEGDKAAQRSVTLGDRYQDSFVVTKGLKPGERVVVEGVQRVRPGMQVKVEPK
ncbi:MAG: efflux RND transporter periplasmic adaptor subunit [Candidatus Rokuibacteriota bacterium]